MGTVVTGEGGDEVVGVVGGGDVVFVLGHGVGDTEAEAVAETAVGGELERVVPAAAALLAVVNDGQTVERAKGVDVDAGVGLDCAGEELVQVADAVQIDGGFADIGGVNHDTEGKFALERDAVVVRGWVVVFQGERTEGEGELGAAAAAGGVDNAVDDVDAVLIRGVAEERAVVEEIAGFVGTAAGAEDGLGIEAPGEAEAGGKVGVVLVNESFWSATEETLDVGNGGAESAAFGRIGVRRSALDDAVVGVAADDRASARVEGGAGGGSEEAGIEVGDVVPLGGPGGEVRVADAEFEGEIGTKFPGVLGEELVGVGADVGVGGGADFEVGVEVAEGGIGDGVASGGGVTGIAEGEPAVLVEGDLIGVDLGVAAEESAEFQGVAGVQDPGEVIGETDHGAGGASGLGGAVEGGEAGDVDGGDAIGDALRARDEVTEVDAIAGAFVAVDTIEGVKRHLDDIVGGGGGELVDFIRGERGRDAESARFVGAAPAGIGDGEGAAEGVIFGEVEVGSGEGETG